MGMTQKPLVIDNPSQKLLDFVRNMEKRKEETRKGLRSKGDLYFPKKMI